MEKRAIVAIILTFAVLLLWGVIESKFFPKAPPPPPAQEVKKEQVPSPEKKAEEKEGVPGAKVLKEGQSIPAVKVMEKKEVQVETENFIAVLTSEDARLKHVRLKKFKDRAEQHPAAIKITQLVKSILGEKAVPPPEPGPLDLVNTSAEEGLPLGLTFSDPQFAQSGGYWEVDKENLKLLNPGEKGEITFVKTFENGAKVFKRYRFTAENEAVEVEVEVENQSDKDLNTQLGLEWIGRVELKKLAAEENKDFGLKYSFLKGQKVEVKEFGGASSSGCAPGCGSTKTQMDPFQFSDKGEIGWFSFGGEYFVAMMFPPPAEKNVTLAVKGNERDILTATVMSSPLSVPSRQSVKVPFQVYMGPKAEERLKALGRRAEKLIDFGYFTVVAKPILWFLNLTHQATKNYGIDIIIVSIILKIIFLPLTQMSFKSMKEMQKVQPEMARLKETYKDDKARLQQEIMLLYKRRKINPMSGCLPMVVQIPVFIALYNALQNTMEMRHAPFFLWITDLSAKDPLYISPIIMGASMVIQQKMTPSAADPMQAKLFLLMPVMFTFMFLSFPSGLVIYWLVNNVLSIAHQYYLNKKL